MKPRPVAQFEFCEVINVNLKLVLVLGIYFTGALNLFSGLIITCISFSEMSFQHTLISEPQFIIKYQQNFYI